MQQIFGKKPILITDYLTCRTEKIQVPDESEEISSLIGSILKIVVSQN
jgi:hypothetical protein